MTASELLALIDQAAEEGWTELDLSGKGLTKLPPEIGKLNNIERLVLGRVDDWDDVDGIWSPNTTTNQLKTLPKEFEKLQSLLILDLSGNPLTVIPECVFQIQTITIFRAVKVGLFEIPQEISQLRNLTELSLDNNKISKLPDSLGELINLTALYLANNEIEDFPKCIGRLRELTHFSLSANKIDKISHILSHLTRLRYCSIHSNQIRTIPDSLKNLANLTHLYLYGNKIETIPDSVTSLKRLTFLSLFNNKIIDIPDRICHLEELEELYLDRNMIHEIPSKISSLKNLKHFSLDGNKISNLPASVGRLTNLKTLYLDSNQISEIPKSISNLEKLKTLSLNKNRISKIPSNIKNLKSLTTLYLYGNQISKIPEGLSELCNLTELYLDNNNIFEIPESLEKLSNLKRLDIFDNPLPISPEILGNNKIPGSPSEIFDYCKRMRSSEVRPLNEAKLLLVGQSSVGKTSLIERLLHSRYNENQPQTDGLNVLSWSVHVNSKDVRLNVWDFGGQEVYHSTHQFFLTKRSLYILTCNCRTSEEENRIEYWLQLIKSFGGESPVIIVGNKCDEQPLDIQRNALSKKYPNIKAILETSCKTNEGIVKLLTTIENEVAKMDDVYNLLPLSWFQVKEQLEALEQDFISYSQYLKVCFQNDVIEESDQEQLIELLHNLGLVLNFREHPILHGTNVLNPDWVTEGIYALLSDDTLKTTSKGILTHTDLTRVLNPYRYPRKRHKYLTTLMQEFELCYQLPNCPTTNFLIPGILPKDEPQNIELPGESECNGTKETLNFQYHYRVLPVSILSRFIVNTHERIHESIQWRNGVMLAYYDGSSEPKNIARIKADTEDRKVFITISGNPNTRRVFLGLIRDIFNKIHNSFASLEITECVPVPAYPNHPPLDYQELLGLEAMGEREYPIGKLRIKVNLRQLLEGYEPIEARRLSQLGSFEKEGLLDRQIRNMRSDKLPQVVVNNIIGDNNSNQSVIGNKNNTGQIQGNDNISRQSQSSPPQNA